MKHTGIIFRFSFLMLMMACLISPLQAQYVVSNNSKGLHKFKSSNGKNSLEVQYKGEIKISDDDRSIIDMSNDGFLQIKKKAFGNERSIEITKRGGRLEYEYRVGGRNASESEGKDWLSDVLLEVVRRSSIGAEDRVKRFMRRGGVSALMREVEQIESSSAKRVYLHLLLSNYDLNNRELSSVLTNAKSISSSSAKGSLFRKHYLLFMKDDRLASQFFETVGSIPSSSEKGSILRTALKDRQLSTEMKLACLDATSGIASSSEKGSILRMMVEGDMLSDREVARGFFETLNKISSSSEKGSVLRKLLDQKDGWNETTATLFFESVTRISSSSEKGSILRKGAFLVQSDRTMTPYFDALKSISSGSEKGSSLRSLLNEQHSTLSKSAYVEILRAAKSLSSSSEKGSVLRLTAQHMDQNDRDIMEAFEDAAESISSSSEYRSVMSTLRSGKSREH